MQNSIEQTVIKTRQYWYIDGFNEMLTGVVFLLLAGLNAFSGWTEPSLTAGLFVGIGFPLVILGGIFIGGRVVKYLKNRVTFPRTGFVQYIQPEPSVRRKKAIKAGAVSAVISILIGIFASDFNPAVITVGTGLLIAIMMVVFAVRIPLKRFYLTSSIYDNLRNYWGKPQGGAPIPDCHLNGWDWFDFTFKRFVRPVKISGDHTTVRYWHGRSEVNEDWKSLTEVDKLIHEPSRLMILTILNVVDKADFVYLQRETGLTRGNLSVHLTKLNEAGYIDIQKTFNGKIPQTICRITEIGKIAFLNYSEYLQKGFQQDHNLQLNWRL